MKEPVRVDRYVRPAECAEADVNVPLLPWSFPVCGRIELCNGLAGPRLRVKAHRGARRYAAAGQTMGAVLGQFGGVLKSEAVLAYEVSQFAALDATSQVVPGRDRQEGTGVVVETRCVGITGRLCDGAAVPPYAFYRIEKPPRRTEEQAGVMARQGSQFAAVGRLVQSKEDDSEARVSFPNLSSKGRSEPT